MAAESKGKGLRRSAEEWRALIAEYEGGAGGVEEFCRCRGISAASFYRWRGRLGTSPGALAETPEEDERAAFVDLGTLNPQNTAPSIKPRRDLRFDLGDGLVLHSVPEAPSSGNHRSVIGASRRTWTPAGHRRLSGATKAARGRARRQPSGPPP
ncbi:MAG: transposase [Candidatus Accumulibacter sp.]|uniref:IS66 family insertion sequence element accessory protein TnpA n=1 Tax=Accumulibacter sp. TaxID=2053492 RepID=UPI0025E5CB48|nr:hypothetical protein [Accumulibacter sp.]MCM8600040.1 transposase [Accumulibacter sp.]